MNVRRTKMTREELAYWIRNQSQWIVQCGGDRLGYMANYGTERGSDIFDADHNYLTALLNEWINRFGRGEKTNVR